MEKFSFYLVKNCLQLATICALLALSGCSSSASSVPEEKPAPVILPCYVESRLPDDAMGRLGIQVIKINNVQRIVIPTDTVFEPRTAYIMEKAHPGLNELAIYLHKYKTAKMAVTGYTDDLGTGPDDVTLSEQQARSLISYLWTRGIPHECLTPMGMGKNEETTVASNRYIEGAAANRRIEITFKAKSRYAPV